jgi:hypothetical protein
MKKTPLDEIDAENKVAEILTEEIKETHQH